MYVNIMQTYTDPDLLTNVKSKFICYLHKRIYVTV